MRRFVSRFTAKFFNDALPVALAGGIATLAVGHFSKSEKPEGVTTRIETPARNVGDEHTIITDALKREAETRQRADAEQDRAFKAEQTKAKAEKLAQEKQEKQEKAERLAQEKAEQERVAVEKRAAAEKRLAAAREEARQDAARREIEIAMRKSAKSEAEAAAAADKARTGFDPDRVAKAIGTTPTAAQPVAPVVAPQVAAPAPAASAPPLPAPVAVAPVPQPTGQASVQPNTQPMPLQPDAGKTERKESVGVTVRNTVRDAATSAGQTASRVWDSVFDISTPPVPPAPIPTGRFSGS